MKIASDIVEWDLLLEVVWSALAAGVAVTVAVSFGIFGANRFAEARRAANPAAAVVYGTVFLLGLAACVLAVVLGIVVMTAKD
jgi:formate/nitrite transporter FocA (FNT family)